MKVSFTRDLMGKKLVEASQEESGEAGAVLG